MGRYLPFFEGRGCFILKKTGITGDRTDMPEGLKVQKRRKKQKRLRRAKSESSLEEEDWDLPPARTQLSTASLLGGWRFAMFLMFVLFLFCFGFFLVFFFLFFLAVCLLYLLYCNFIVCSFVFSFIFLLKLFDCY